jgi:hypothetical protein
MAKCAWQRPPTTRPTTFHVWKTRGWQCSFRLLMMGGLSPETCWASDKYGKIKFWYIVASCWIFLYESIMMHGSTNIKFPTFLATLVSSSARLGRFCSLLDRESDGTKILRNVGNYNSKRHRVTGSHPIRHVSSATALWQINILPIPKIFKLVSNRKGAGVSLKLLYPDPSISFIKSRQRHEHGFLAYRLPAGAKEFSVLLKSPGRVWGPTDLLFSGQCGHFLRDRRSSVVHLTTYPFQCRD